MELLFIVGLALVLVFSASLGWYLTQYTLAVRGGLLKVVTFSVLGTCIFATTFAVSVFVVWPPFLPL
ncbi:hypothetical protein SY88_03080 [Clostridiales bacterium PH28_bin88]|nr:hypothetical protein SY88_03080 [Clostridiales bacterium PH28_bin88]